jgi:hypothetical protein
MIREPVEPNEVTRIRDEKQRIYSSLRANVRRGEANRVCPRGTALIASLSSVSSSISVICSTAAYQPYFKVGIHLSLKDDTLRGDQWVGRMLAPRISRGLRGRAFGVRCSVTWCHGRPKRAAASCWLNQGHRDRSCQKIGKTDQIINVSECRSSRSLVKTR